MFRCGGNGFPSNSKIKKDRKAYGAVPLPKNRPRALTLPLEESGKISTFQSKFQEIFRKRIQQQTFTQKQSPLLRLPPEIRLIIWKFVLCNQHLHIVRAPRRLLAIRCDEDRPQKPGYSPYGHRCWGYTTIFTRHGRHASGYYRDPKPDSRCGFANLLPIVKTCRLV
ncbi:hypothetical protein O181_001184 [Austropuccinia psidii MF-1]|uniref:DUF7730 domain-containing protein n=1 Tax=Austropuccinia psidii MF-1 TaxID=1389203 RepID=A0A9Q3GBL7_9BASI|nr:hypothetical protein [Austropuccinia psidii MF-1]